MNHPQYRVDAIDDAIDDILEWAIPTPPGVCEMINRTDTQLLDDASLPVASGCYASYIPDIDDGDSLSCHGADTCAREISLEFKGKNTSKLCASCPVVRLGDYGISSYGCDVLTKTCRCGYVPQERTYCTSNSECLTKMASCSLITDTSTGRSSGGIPCTQCTSMDPICLVSHGGIAGQCACPVQEEPFAKCDKSTRVNERMGTGSGVLCATTLYNHMKTESTGSLDWGSLVVAPCAQVGETTCIQVAPFTYNLAVGMDGPVGRSAFDGNSARRRSLLATSSNWATIMSHTADTFEWSHTASPCSDLMQALRDSPDLLGVLDRLTILDCIHWRRIAVSLILDNNMTALTNHDYLLLGIRDFTRAITHRGVIQSLLKTPRFWAGVAYHHPWMEPLRTIFSHITLYLQYADNGKQYVKFLIETLNGTSLNNLTDGTMFPFNVSSWGLPKMMLWDEEVSEELKQFTQSQASIVNILTRNMNTVDRRNKRGSSDRHPKQPGQDPKQPGQDPKQPGQETHMPTANSSAGTGSPVHVVKRKLLQSTDTPLQAQSALWSTYVSNGVINIPIGGALGDIWIEGPVGWPPRFEYWSGDHQCAAASVVVDLGIETMSTVYRSYAQGFGGGVFAPLPLTFKQIVGLDRRAAGNHRRISDASETTVVFPDNNLWTIPGSKLSVAEKYYEWFGTNVVQGIFAQTPDSIAAFFLPAPLGSPKGTMTLGTIAKGILVCDLEATTMCTRRNINVVMALLISIATYTIISWALGLVGLNALSSAFIFMIPLLTLYIAYGYSPTCVPQVPVCFIRDMYDTLIVLIPPSIVWPNALQSSPDCINGMLNKSSTRGYSNGGYSNIGQTCLVSCNSPKFGFDAWEKSLAWIVCSFVDECDHITLPYGIYLDTYQQQAVASRAILASADTDLINSNTYCFFVTLASILPWVFILIALVFLLISSIQLPFIFMTASVQFMTSAIGYTHAE